MPDYWRLLRAGVVLKSVRAPFARLIALALAALSVALSPATAQRGGPASVFVETVEEREFSNRIEALGTLQANERVELSVNVADRVTGVYFDDGERVEKGQTLLSLVQGEQAAQVDGAAARVSEARQVVDRMQPLVSDGVVSAVQFDQAKRDLQVARSELTALRIQQKERVLVAPFNGVLGFRRVSVGAFVAPGDTIATLVDDSVMKLDFDVPSLAVREVQKGLKVKALTDDFPGEVFEGEVLSVDNVIDPITRSVTVRALIPNEERKLRPGSFMSVVLEADPSRSLAVPEEAVEPVGPLSFVFIAVPEGEGFIARRRQVELARREGGFIEVSSGLDAGDRVITEGVIRVREGAPVVIREESMLLPDGSPSAVNSSSTASPG